jgi:hypothetical protein
MYFVIHCYHVHQSSEIVHTYTLSLPVYSQWPGEFSFDSAIHHSIVCLTLGL